MMTYSDLLQHVSRTVYGFGAGTGASASRDQIRSAIQMAYRKLPTYGPWHRYTSTLRLTVLPPVTHTVQVASDGLTLTSTDGAWPLWAPGNTVAIGNAVAEVSSVNDTVLTLATPVEGNYFSKTAQATLYNDRHQLPSDFVSPQFVTLISPPREVTVVVQAHALRIYRYPKVASIPDVAYISSSQNTTHINFLPYPTTRVDIDITYTRSLQPIVFTGMDAVDSDGTVSVDGDTVTGIGTQFKSSMVGAMFRVGTATDHPTDLAGFAPYVAEAEIASVTSATQLTLASSIGSYDSVRYCITSVLDVDDHVFPVLLSLSLVELSAMIGKQIPTNLREALLQARAAESNYSTASPIRGIRSGLYLVGRINYE